MLDLEVIPERSLGCPEKSWEFILGELFSLFIVFLHKKITKKLAFSYRRNAFFSGCCNHPNPGGDHQKRTSLVQ
jgi:hypothetical protein